MNKLTTYAFIELFKEVAKDCYENSKAHGFWEAERNRPEMLALMHSELSEALEYYRKGDKQSDHIPEFTGVEEELADVIIRVMDYAHGFKHRVAEAVIAKMEFNKSRPHKHGKVC